MATKRKAKKAPAKKPPAKRKARPKAKPAIEVRNHPFEPNSTVGFFPRSMVTVEKGMGREPFPDPIAKAKVDKAGVLKAKGLGPGAWTAAAETSDGWRYFDFPGSP